MNVEHDQWIRKVQLSVISKSKAVDLSQFRITFQTQNADVETPNNAIIRVYNLRTDEVNSITASGEYSRVILQAGYVGMGAESPNFGIIFDGDIKQFRTGKENNIDNYLDILAADGDLIYNNGIVSQSFAAGTTPAQNVVEAAKAAARSVGKDEKVQADAINAALASSDPAHVPNIRGVVQFGLARAVLGDVGRSIGYTWSIQNGTIQMTKLNGYSSDTAVKINRNTGLVGTPEQTDGGIKLKCLLNPRIKIGGLVQLNNDEINQLMQQNPNDLLPYNQRASVQYNTPLSKDGFYRAYSVEHHGDTRGHEWYSEIICLTADVSSGTTTPK